MAFSYPLSAGTGDTVVRIGLFHMKPELGQMTQNLNQVRRAMVAAKHQGVDWMTTPELALTGYRFARTIGGDWIKPGPDRYVQQLQQAAADIQTPLLLGHLEEDVDTGKRYNTLFVIDGSGDIIARHRKINTIPIAEAWSRKGTEPTLVRLGNLSVGLLICADAWPSEHAMALKEAGAQLIINSATWPPGEHGPGETWEKRSAETGLPIFVNNRTGVEQTFDIRRAQSVLSYRGQRLFSFASETPELIILEWDYGVGRLVSQKTVGIAE